MNIMLLFLVKQDTTIPEKEPQYYHVYSRHKLQIKLNHSETNQWIYVYKVSF